MCSKTMLVFVILTAVVASSYGQKVNLQDDILDHDCKNIRTIDRNNLHPYLKRIHKIKAPFVKWNHAYGIPIMGIEGFKDESMLKACHLVRFLLAGNEWFRRYSYYYKLSAVGQKGGFCCPAQIGNNGMACGCDGKYPMTGMGAPAHELAHFFIKRVLERIPSNLLTLPAYVEEPSLGVNATYRILAGNGTLNNFLQNSFWGDKLRGSTKIKPKKNGKPKTHHYFIYSGMEKFINAGAGSGEGRVNRREMLRTNNPNLYNILKVVWPCDNVYISPCKDSAYGYTLGQAQTLIIGKHRRINKSGMLCKKNIDKPEIESALPIQPTPTVDQGTSKKCSQVISKKYDLKSLTVGEVESDLKLNSKVDGHGQLLDHGSEFAWWLRKCCAQSAKFPGAAESHDLMADNVDQEMENEEEYKEFDDDNGSNTFILKE